MNVNVGCSVCGRNNITAQSQVIYEFGPFRFEPHSLRLYCNNQTVPLGLKASEILLVLIEHQGMLLTRNDLMQAVWCDIYVEDSNLSTHISILRRTLADLSNGQNYVETLHRRGYRFDGTVKKVVYETAEAITESAVSYHAQHLEDNDQSRQIFKKPTSLDAQQLEGSDQSRQTFKKPTSLSFILTTSRTPLILTQCLLPLLTIIQGVNLWVVLGMFIINTAGIIYLNTRH